MKVNILNNKDLLEYTFENNIKKAINIINEYTNSNTRLKLLSIRGKRPLIVKLFGGLNGWGEWIEYFETLKRLLSIMKYEYNTDMWLINLENDCLDDVFYAEFGAKVLDKNK